MRSGMVRAALGIVVLLIVLVTVRQSTPHWVLLSPGDQTALWPGDVDMFATPVSGSLHAWGGPYRSQDACEVLLDNLKLQARRLLPAESIRGAEHIDHALSTRCHKIYWGEAGY